MSTPIYLEQQLSARLSKKGFHGFTREAKTNIVMFFAPKGYEKQYSVDVLENGRLDLRLNAQPISEFDNADDLCDFLLV